MSKHTPSPWLSSGSIITRNEPLFVMSEPRADAGKGRTIICRIANTVSGRPLEDEDFANANLIAAAPDLLEALEEAKVAFIDYEMTVAGECDAPSKHRRMMLKIDQAIAFAKAILVICDSIPDCEYDDENEMERGE